MNNTLKWNITAEEKAQYEQTQVSLNHIISKAQAEKDAKANGLWDYRNNKIVEA